MRQEEGPGGAAGGVAVQACFFLTSKQLYHLPSLAVGELSAQQKQFHRPQVLWDLKPRAGGEPDHVRSCWRAALEETLALDWT